MKIDEDDREVELHLELKKARRMKAPHMANLPKFADVKKELDSTEPGPSGHIVLNSTAEFCRTLGDIPTYGLAGNREENDQELMVLFSIHVIFLEDSNAIP